MCAMLRGFSRFRVDKWLVERSLVALGAASRFPVAGVWTTLGVSVHKRVAIAGSCTTGFDTLQLFDFP
jgi:hypothetical protein